jgi:hypothetical protein
MSASSFSEADHPLAYQVAGEQKDAEAEHDGCRSESPACARSDFRAGLYPLAAVR